MTHRFLGAVLLLVVGLAPAQTQTPLEWKFKKGQHFYLRCVTTTNQTLRVPSLKKEVDPNSSEQTVVLGFEVLDVAADKGIALKETIEEVYIKPTNSIGANKPAPYSVSSIVGAAFNIEITPKGDIRKFEGYDKLIGMLAGDDQAVRQALLATIQEDTLKKTVREVLLFLPDTPAKDGMKWEQTVDEPFGALGTLHDTRKFQYMGKADHLGAKLDQIDFTTDATYTEGKKIGDHNYFVREGKVVVDPEKSKGTIFFDSTNGQLVDIKSNVRLKGTFSLSISNVRVDMEVEQNQATTVQYFATKPAKAGTSGAE